MSCCKMFMTKLKTKSEDKFKLGFKQLLESGVVHGKRSDNCLSGYILTMKTRIIRLTLLKLILKS